MQRGQQLGKGGLELELPSRKLWTASLLGGSEAPAPDPEWRKSYNALKLRLTHTEVCGPFIHEDWVKKGANKALEWISLKGRLRFTQDPRN